MKLIEKLDLVTNEYEGKISRGAGVSGSNRNSERICVLKNTRAIPALWEHRLLTHMLVCFCEGLTFPIWVYLGKDLGGTGWVGAISLTLKPSREKVVSKSLVPWRAWE